MPNIQEDLQKIMDARYGKDVRKSIHDAISDINDVADHAEEVAETAQDSAAASAQAAAQSATDAETSKTSAVNAKNAANTAKNAAQTAQTAAETAQAAAERAVSTASAIVEDVDEIKVQVIAAQVAAEAAESGAQTAQSGAETAKTNAQTAQTAAETARTGAQNAQSNAEAAVLDAEAYARGTRNGSPVPSTDPAYENNSKYYSEQIGPYALDSEAYAKGTKHGTPVPSTDPAYENNSKYFMELANYWYLQAKAIAEGFSGALIPMGTVAFANLPAIATVTAGSMYNISDEFTTTSDFVEGAGHVIPMGANIYKTNAGKWDILAGSPVTGVKGSAEQNFRQGNVEISKANVGLGNVPNTDFTADVAASVRKFSDSAYQTVDQLAYNPTTKKLGLKVGGADTVIPFSGGADAKFYFNNVLQNNKVAQLKAVNALSNPNKFETIKSKIPFDTAQSSAIWYNGKIELVGSKAKPKIRAIYDPVSGDWKVYEKESPWNNYRGVAIVYNGLRYYLGGESNLKAVREWNDNGSWWTSQTISSLPFNFYDGGAFVINNELHILGSSYSADNKKHYKWNGSAWVQVSTLPSSCIGRRMCVLNNEIHLFTNSKHYKWNGTEWSTLGDLPSSLAPTITVTLADGIHLIGSNTATNAKMHYKWDGTDFIQMSDIPSMYGEFYSNHPPYVDGGSGSSKYTFLNIIDSRSDNYIQTYNYTYGWNPYSYMFADQVNGNQIYTPFEDAFASTSVTLNDELYVIGGAEFGDGWGYPRLFYKFNGSKWTKLADVPTGYDGYILAAVVNNEIHILKNNQHHKFNGTSWVSVSTPPILLDYNEYGSDDHSYGCVCTYKNELYLVGWDHNIYKFNGSTWDTVYTMTPAANNDYIACAVSYNGLMYLFETNTSKIYTFDGVTLLDTGSVLPIGLHLYVGNDDTDPVGFIPKALVLNNQIHLFAFTPNGSGASYGNGVFHHLVLNSAGYWKSVASPLESSDYMIGFVGELNGELYSSITKEDTYSYYHCYLVKQSKKVITKQYIFPGVSRNPTGSLSSLLIATVGNVVHFLGGLTASQAHYTWDGTNWTQLADTPFVPYGSGIVVLNGDIHILGGSISGCQTQHYKYHNGEWSSVSTLPENFKNDRACAALNGKIYLFGTSNHSNRLYVWDGTSWTLSATAIPSTISDYKSKAIATNNAIYICTTSHYIVTFVDKDGAANFYSSDTIKGYFDFEETQSTGTSLNLVNINNVIYTIFPKEYYSKAYVLDTSKAYNAFSFDVVNPTFSEMFELNNDIYIMDTLSGGKIYKIIPETYYYIESGIDNITLE